MKCFSCKSEKILTTTETYFTRLNNCYIIIENVPCEKCQECGEIFFSANALEKIETIIDGLTNLTEKVYIMDYTKTAA